MGQDSNQKVIEIAYRILKYLDKNPNAEDTSRGIVGWWLVQQAMEVEAIYVQQALDSLVSKRLIKESLNPDNQILYQINRQNLKKVKAFLKQSNAGGLHHSEQP